MLKIKDNKDLKKLKKYGFVKSKYCFELRLCGYSITIDDVDKFIMLYDDETEKFYSIPCELFDLIKDDLVKKVEE